MDAEFERRKLGRRYYPNSTIVLILERIRSGLTVVEACENPAFPCAASLYNWINSDEGLRQQYEQALAEGRARRQKMQCN